MDSISRETFKAMDTNSKLDVLFDYAVSAAVHAKAASDKVELIQVQAAKWGGVAGVFTAVGAYLAACLISHISK